MENRKSDIHISHNIARLRRKMGLTQTELADRLYVSNKTVSKWERGAGYPETPQLVRLADLFGVSLDPFHAWLRKTRFSPSLKNPCFGGEKTDMPKSVSV